MKGLVMRRTVLLSMVLLTTACGGVEEKKDAMFRQLGKAALNGVIRLASSGEAPAAESVVRPQEVSTIALAEPASEPLAEPVAVATADAPAKPFEPEPASVTVEEQNSFEYSFARMDIHPAPAPSRRMLVGKRETELLRREIAKLVEVNRVEVGLGLKAHETAVAGSRIAAAALAERPRQIAHFEILFADEHEKARRLIPPPPVVAPVAPVKECATQERTAS